jgi:hypothetical protein
MPIKGICWKCDKVYNLADEMAGKKLKCKECGEAFTVKSAKGAQGVKADRSSPAAPKKGRGRGDEDDRPRRKSKPAAKKGGAMVWWLVGGGGAALLLLVLVGGGIIAAVVLWPTKATPENFAKIKNGMSEKEVVEIMGRPSEGVSMDNAFTRLAGMKMPNVKELIWEGKKNTTYVVMFQDDKVVMKVGSDGRNFTGGFGDDDDMWGGFQPPVGNTSTNLANISRVRVGMTEAEVLSVMGPPTTTLSSQPNQKTLFWNGSVGDSVSVGIKDGRVFMGGGAINGEPINISGNK